MKKNIFLRAAAVLLVLTMGTTSLLSGMLARYATGGRGADNARVAAFGDLTLKEDNPDLLDLIPGVAVAFAPTVTMTESEVAVAVYVDITPGSGWTYEGGSFSAYDGYLTWALTSDWQFREEREGVYTFYRQLAVGDTLTDAPVIADPGIQVAKAYDTYYSTVKTDDLAIALEARAVQID